MKSIIHLLLINKSIMVNNKYCGFLFIYIYMCVCIWVVLFFNI